MAPKITDALNQFLTSPAKGRNLSIAAILLLSVIGFGSLIFWNSRPDYQVLFSNLSQEDAGEMVNKLKERKVPFQLTNNGTTLLIPREQVYEVRLSFATEGLPKGGGVGFEVFDRTNLGTTDFVQKLNYQRALQGELSRTIKQIKEIEQARVHIVTPKESLFVEEQKKPTASVLVKTRSSMTLAPAQVEGIVNLVSSAVEGLEPGNITIVDTTGKVLFKRTDSTLMGQLTTTQLEYQKNIEENLKKKVQGMLEEVLGPSKAIARISTDIDFQQVEITEEKYDPTGVLRSEQKNAEKSSTTQVLPPSSGEPKEGTLELKGNDPKKGATPENLKVQTKGSPPSPVNLTSADRQSEIRNYEISKVNKHIRAPMGKVAKVSAAVVVDGSYQGSGKNRQYVSRNPDEMKNLENIVKKAIGYDEDRKDQVEVINMPFYWSVMEEETKNEEKIPVWEKYLQMYYKPAISLILAFLFIFFVVRPFLKKRSFSPENEEASLLQSVPPGTLPPQVAQVAQVAQEKKPPAVSYKDQVVQIAQEDPSKTASIVKTWLQEKE
ncbi:MAG: flagellar basal-body MS-ring/collar protein FliF [Deltaproteobacteria bacterium]